LVVLIFEFKAIVLKICWWWWSDGYCWFLYQIWSACYILKIWKINLFHQP